MSMNTFVVDDISVTVPPEVNDLDSFRQWARSEQCPERGRIAYLQGQVWIDMSKEQIFSLNQVKNEIAFVLTGIAKRKKLGRYFPDGVFVLFAGFDVGRVRLVEAKGGSSN